MGVLIHKKSFIRDVRSNKRLSLHLWANIVFYNLQLIGQEERPIWSGVQNYFNANFVLIE